jgi:hypothetical protein
LFCNVSKAMANIIHDPLAPSACKMFLNIF